MTPQVSDRHLLAPIHRYLQARWPDYDYFVPSNAPYGTVQGRARRANGQLPARFSVAARLCFQSATNEEEIQTVWIPHHRGNSIIHGTPDEGSQHEPFPPREWLERFLDLNQPVYNRRLNELLRGVSGIIVAGCSKITTVCARGKSWECTGTLTEEGKLALFGEDLDVLAGRHTPLRMTFRVSKTNRRALSIEWKRRDAPSKHSARKVLESRIDDFLNHDALGQRLLQWKFDARRTLTADPKQNPQQSLSVEAS